MEPLFQLGFGKRPREELYHLVDDPSYMRNLAAEPSAEGIRARMEARLLSILEEQNDPRLMEQPCRYELEPYAGPADWSPEDPPRPGKTSQAELSRAYAAERERSEAAPPKISAEQAHENMQEMLRRAKVPIERQRDGTPVRPAAPRL